MILIGTGSEVQSASPPGSGSRPRASPTRVVSMPCQEWFAEQDAAYRQQVLPPGVKARVSVEAGVRRAGDELVGDAGEIVSIEHYGASAAVQRAVRAVRLHRRPRRWRRAHAVPGQRSAATHPPATDDRRILKEDRR